MPAKTLAHLLCNLSTKGVFETPFKGRELGQYPDKPWGPAFVHHQGFCQQGLFCIQLHHSSEQGDSKAPHVPNLYISARQAES